VLEYWLRKCATGTTATSTIGAAVGLSVGDGSTEAVAVGLDDELAAEAVAEAGGVLGATVALERAVSGLGVAVLPTRPPVTGMRIASPRIAMIATSGARFIRRC
jgi:hypothetical protein